MSKPKISVEKQHSFYVRSGASVMTRDGKTNPNFTSTDFAKSCARDFVTGAI